MKENLKIKAETVSAAMEKLYKKIPAGFFLISLEEYEPVALARRASADTIEEALKKAKQEISEDVMDIKETIVRKPHKDIIELHAFDEEEARGAAMDKNAEAVHIVRVGIMEEGSRGFLGFGKKPNVYSIELFYQSIGEVDCMAYAEISAEITDEKDIANEYFLNHSENGNYQLVEHLLQQGVNIHACNTNGATALILSAFNGYSNISNLLIDNGLDINKRDHDGFSSLMVACECANADIALVKRLVGLGADINATSERKATALMAAAKIGHPDIVEFLVLKGADINARNADHNITALIWAANCGHLSIVEFLLEKGADPSIRTFNNYTATTIAMENYHYSIVEVLDHYSKGV